MSSILGMVSKGVKSVLSNLKSALGLSCECTYDPRLQLNLSMKQLRSAADNGRGWTELL